MSLSIYLTADKPITVTSTGVYVRENGQNRELSIQEVKERWPNSDIEESIYETTEVFDGNITHNLTKMAEAAGIYEALWAPEEKGWTHARHVTAALEAGLEQLKNAPDHFKQFTWHNGWGTYEQLVSFVEEYLAACKKYPDAEIGICK